MTVGVLALQGDFREHREMLERMGHHVSEIRKTAQLDEIDALIIPGGESTTIARLILSNGFQQPLRDFCATGKPVWGTCAGAILLAKRVDKATIDGIKEGETVCLWRPPLTFYYSAQFHGRRYRVIEGETPAACGTARVVP